MTATAALTGGFADAPVDAAHAFRAIMTVMARPGEIRTAAQATPPAPLSVAAGTVILTLCDPEAGLYLAGPCDTPQVRDWVAFHTGAPFAGPENCTFAVGRWETLAPLSAYPVGTPDYPDRSATLIVECTTLAAEGAALSGPGIRDRAALSLPEVAAFRDNHARFPLGLDFLFTCDTSIAALPRSTRVHDAETV